MLRRFWEKGQVAVSYMEFDGRPVAVSYAFPYKQRWINCNWVHDPEASKLSPGTLLIAFMIMDAIDRGFVEFDLTRGDEGYKRRFANQQKQNTGLVIHRTLCAYMAYRLRPLLERGRRSLAVHAPRLHSWRIAPGPEVRRWWQPFTSGRRRRCVLLRRRWP